MAGGFPNPIPGLAPGAALIELFDSRRETMSERPSAELHYLAVNCGDEGVVRLQCGAIPSYYNNIPLQSIEIAERVNDTTWKIIARFGIQNQTVVQYDTSGGTQHITQSIQTVSKYGDYCDDLAGAIGYDGEHVQGVDIVIPNLTWAETYFLTDSQVAAAYPYYYMLTGKVNSYVFRGLDTGRCCSWAARARNAVQRVCGRSRSSSPSR